MKKTLIALAAVAVTGAASAQSAELYGRFDLGYSNSSVTDDAGVVTKETSLAGAEGNRTGNRLGFKGTEDLGGGLKAAYVYELTLNADRGVTSGTRLANVAVTGSFGTVAIGTFNNVFDDMIGASVANLTGSGDTGLLIVNTAGRSQNAIAFQSPSFNGLTVGVGTSNETAKVDGVIEDGSLSGSIVNARYNSGDLSVLLGISNAKLQDDGTVIGVGEVKASETAVKASYNLGMAVPYAVYSTYKVKLAGTTVAETKGYDLGATFPMGNVTPFVSVARNTITDTVAATDEKLSGYAVGAQYTLSKRTTAYAQMTKSKVKTTTEKATLTQIGLIHNF